MKQHLIFPTLIGEFEYEFPEQFKETFFECVHNYVDQHGNSNEKTGHVAIHHGPEFEPLYQFIGQCINRHLSAYGSDPDQMDAYIVKSWLNIIRDIQTPYHSHADAHLSFVYYVNLPNDIVEPIRFFNESNFGRFEPYPGFTKYANHSNKWDHINAQSWEFYPSEGNLIIFPANMPHDTELKNGSVKNMESQNFPLEKMKTKRISIAGDVILTFKEKTGVSMGLQPVKNWKKI
jgi:hypothetical protein